MVIYYGKSYAHHCNKKPRQAIVFITCDYSADTHVSFAKSLLKINYDRALVAQLSKQWPPTTEAMGSSPVLNI